MLYLWFGSDSKPFVHGLVLSLSYGHEDGIIIHRLLLYLSLLSKVRGRWWHPFCYCKILLEKLLGGYCSRLIPSPELVHLFLRLLPTLVKKLRSRFPIFIKFEYFTIVDREFKFLHVSLGELSYNNLDRRIYFAVFGA